VCTRTSFHHLIPRALLHADPFRAAYTVFKVLTLCK
jgi:hypothetical protein